MKNLSKQKPFLAYDEQIEKHIKSLLAYSFCQSYGEQQSAYLDATKYNYSGVNQPKINELVGRLDKLTKPPYDQKYMTHQANKYGNIPLWVTLKALPFGSISIMYSLIKHSEQAKISKEFIGVNEGTLARHLDILSRIRNVCAHNERLYDYRYNKGSIPDSEVHKSLRIPKKYSGYKEGKSDLFAVLIAMKFLLNITEFKKMIDAIEIEIKILCKNTSAIQYDQILKYMGFPQNWAKINNINVAEISEGV